MSKEQKEKEEQEKLDLAYDVEHCSFIDHKKLDPLKRLNNELDPNFLERLGVQANVKDLIKEAYNGEMNERKYMMFAAVTAELFYIKACVNCMNAFDPVAARAKAYLAAISYDIYVTTIRLRVAAGIPESTEQSENQPAQEVEERRRKPFFVRLLQTIMTKKTKVPVKTKEEELATQNSKFTGTMLTLMQRVGKVQKDAEIYLEKKERLTIDKFIEEAFRFVGNANVNKEAPAIEKLAHFADHVLYPFAAQCNSEANAFYTSLRSLPFSFKFLSNTSQDRKQFNLVASEFSSTRKRYRNLSGVFRPQSWIDDLLTIVSRYQMILTSGESRHLNLRTFRVAYAKHKKGTVASDMFYEEANLSLKKASPFLQLIFLFKLKDESIFDCFDPKKVNEENVDQLLAAVGKDQDLVLSKKELLFIIENEFSDDPVGNVIAFEKLIGKNLYLNTK